MNKSSDEACGISARYLDRVLGYPWIAYPACSMIALTLIPFTILMASIEISTNMQGDLIDGMLVSAAVSLVLLMVYQKTFVRLVIPRSLRAACLNMMSTWRGVFVLEVTALDPGNRIGHTIGQCLLWLPPGTVRVKRNGKEDAIRDTIVITGEGSIHSLFASKCMKMAKWPLRMTAALLLVAIVYILYITQTRVAAGSVVFLIALIMCDILLGSFRLPNVVSNNYSSGCSGLESGVATWRDGIWHPFYDDQLDVDLVRVKYIHAESIEDS